MTPVEAALAGDFESLQSDVDIDTAMSGLQAMINAEVSHAQLESHRQDFEHVKKLSEQELTRLQAQVDSCNRAKEQAESVIKDVERRQNALKKMQDTISQLRDRKDWMRPVTSPHRI